MKSLNYCLGILNLIINILDKYGKKTFSTLKTNTKDIYLLTIISHSLNRFSECVYMLGKCMIKSCSYRLNALGNKTTYWFVLKKG